MPSSASSLFTSARWRLWLAGLVLGWCALLPAAWAQQLVPVPTLTARVMDQTGTLSPADKAALETKLATYEQQRGSQLVVLMVATTQPEDIASFAYRVASTWKIGRRNVGDGILIVIAKDDRRMRIEVAKALEGAVPDIAAGRIIDEAMKPRFRSNDFAGGISAAIDQITARLAGEALPALGSNTPQPAQEGVDWMSAIVIVAMISLIGGGILKSLMGRPMGSVATGALAGGSMFLLSGVLLAAGLAGLAGLFIALITGMGGGGGMLPPGGGGRGRGGPIILPGPPADWGRGGNWGGGGGFGGGFGSGGGGDFGGGGASGDW